MVAPGVVLVGQEHDTTAAEGEGSARRPFTGPFTVGGRNQAQVDQAIDILLTLRDEDPGKRVGGTEQGQPVEEPIDPLQAPGPAFGPLWPPA